jgi:hypothetical protein
MSVIKTNTLSTLDGVYTVPSETLARGACRAWVNFDGATGSGDTIRGSFNVSSVTRTGTGAFTVNFTNAMSDANYSVFGTHNALIGSYFPGLLGPSSATALATTSVSLLTIAAVTGSAVVSANPSVCSVSIFR